MIRKIISIDEEKCNGCGLCASACEEGAIALIDGKAKLLRDDYCDGLGNCLPACPTGAISFIEREAAEFDKEAVLRNMANRSGVCSSSTCATMNKPVRIGKRKSPINQEENYFRQSELSQWPVQLKLVPVNAPYFNDASLLIAADCTAYAYANFHEKFMKNRITLIGCPKLDGIDYSDKLTAIIKNNDIKNIKVVRMDVSCCSGLERAVKKALSASGKMIPWQVLIITRDGMVIDE